MAHHARPQRTGAHGEELAAAHLERGGARILARNWRPHGLGLRGELDLVAVHEQRLLVVEVKTRRTDRFGGPLAAVTPTKQAQIRRLARAYLTSERPSCRAVRFDVIAVHLGGELRLEHIAGAF